MKEEHILYPNDSIVIVNCLETLPGGRSLNLDEYDKAVIDAGCVVLKSKEYYPLAGGKLLATVASADKEIKFHKGVSFKVGTEVKKGIKISAIDRSNEGYDLVKLDKLIGEDKEKDTSLYYIDEPTDEWVGIVIGTVLKERPHVGIMVRGTVNEKVMPFTLKEEDKKKLPLIRFYAE